MKILAVDIGTGTQDIFLYDSRLDMENGFKLILPSPTMIVRRQIQDATNHQQPIVLTGVTMGGGPATWAAEAHVRVGLPVFATPSAAQTMNDDLSRVEALGIQIISEDEVNQLPPEVQRIEMRDFNFPLILRVFENFHIPLYDLAAVAVAVFDHGAAPADISDRQFRINYMNERINKENQLSTFAFRSDEIPSILTRLKAVAGSAHNLPVPLVVMDTAPAAIMGALLDPVTRFHERKMIVNIGNFHTLAFRLGYDKIEGVFEHHTGFLNRVSLEKYLEQLADGSLTHEQVFEDHGHGALLVDDTPLSMDNPDYNVIVTGPRRSLLTGSTLGVYQAVPFGDMMITGCFGLIAAVADKIPELGDSIRASFTKNAGSGAPPWELD